MGERMSDFFVWKDGGWGQPNSVAESYFITITFYLWACHVIRNCFHFDKTILKECICEWGLLFSRSARRMMLWGNLHATEARISSGHVLICISVWLVCWELSCGHQRGGVWLERFLCVIAVGFLDLFGIFNLKFVTLTSLSLSFITLSVTRKGV